MQLVRRNHIVGKEVMTYFEPFPVSLLTDVFKDQKNPPQKQQRRLSTDSSMSVESVATRKRGKVVPFDPKGGVTSISAYNLGDSKKKTSVWISFGDGTILRMPHAGFFPSVIQKHSESGANAESLELVLGGALVRCEVRLPPLVDTKATVIPLPKYHPSPLAPFPAWKRPEFDDDHEDRHISEPEQQDSLPDIYEAVVYWTGAMAESFPTLAFYTSEDQFEGRIQGDPVEKNKSDDGGNVIDAVLGGIYGWFGVGKKEVDQLEEPPVKNEQQEFWDPKVPFPSINYEPICLFAGYEIHDAPRQVTYLTVDPEGVLAATADTLGRVSLIDLSTKQIIRMWKGYRDTTCHWDEYEICFAAIRKFGLEQE